jgi:hypothetical protein
MRRRWYKIYTLSVKAMLGYAKPDGDSFTLTLGQATAQSCMKGTGSDKAENALFRQILSVLNISPDSGDGKAFTRSAAGTSAQHVRFRDGDGNHGVDL